jgi:hypothetical protein
MVKIMTMILSVQKCPESWKEGKIVMLPKPCDESEKDQPGNWRPITLTNIMYRIIFGRIAEYVQHVNKRYTQDGNGIVSKEQKGFIKNVKGCCEHGSKVNYLIAEAMAKKKKLYLAALDCKDAFGSISHQILEKNLEQIGIPRRLKNVIVDSYLNSQGRIYSAGSASDPFNMLKGVKQGCPLSPLLFDLCVDPVITYLKENQEDG